MLAGKRAARGNARTQGLSGSIQLQMLTGARKDLLSHRGSKSHRIGAGRAVTDLYYDWAKVREVDESGALLVRPDKHVAWRSMTMPADPRAALYDALARILGRVHASGLG